VEGTGAYGVGLARFLHRASVRVIEVDRPNRQVRRRHGKSDPLDAVEAARAALSGRANGIAKTADGNVEAIRVLLVAKRSARAARTKALTQIRHLGFCAPDELRDQLRDLPVAALASRVAALRPRPGSDVVIHGTKTALQILGRRVLTLDAELARIDLLLEALVVAAAPDLLDLHGVGPDTAAILLVAAGDNAERIRTEAAWANLCGVAPLSVIGAHDPASAQPRRQPPSQPRALADRDHPHELRPAHPDLRAATPRRRAHQARDHPRPQALRRPRDLAAPTPLTIWSGEPGPILPRRRRLSS
jgi:transposase